jgi:hypothetical protein
MRRKSWMGCLLMPSWVLKLAGDAPSAAPLTIFIYDRAHVGSKTLVQAERLATEIFERAGVDTQWTTQSVSDGAALLNDFSAATDKGCPQPLDSATLRAEILPYAPPGFSPQALGYALPCAKSGIQVTIYADRVETVSRTTLAVFYRVLGHALAHDNSGLMKGVWAKSDWLRAAVSTLPFTQGQATVMRQQLQRMEAHDTAPLADQQNERRDVVVLARAADKSIDR